MNDIYSLFVSYIRRYLFSEGLVSSQGERPAAFSDSAVIAQLSELAGAHKLLPVVYEALKSDPENIPVSDEIIPCMYGKILSVTAGKAIRDAEFVSVCRRLAEENRQYIVLKGMAVAAYYPRAYYRWAGDEDLLLSAEGIDFCSEMLKSAGYESVSDGHEISFINKKQGLLLELHPEPFTGRGKTVMNRMFSDAFGNAEALTTEYGDIKVLSGSMQILYVFYHIIKHFIFHGCGVRQLLDLCILLKRVPDKDIAYLREGIKNVGGEQFFSNLTAVGESFFGFSFDEKLCPDTVPCDKTGQEELLSDIIEGGLFGDATESRRLGGAVTGYSDKNGKGGFVTAAFPGVKALKPRYRELNDHPERLPAVWIKRWFGYLKRTVNLGAGDSLKAIAVSRRRLRLIRKQGLY